MEDFGRKVLAHEYIGTSIKRLALKKERDKPTQSIFECKIEHSVPAREDITSSDTQ